MPKKSNLPDKWAAESKAVRAIQLAFDISDNGQYLIRKEALESNITPSDRIRRILKLHLSHMPKRPRLSVSLREEDFVILAERYKIPVDDRRAIKQRATEELLKYINNKLNR
jgi:hypothetical protein